jgi:hypothetical protein
VKTLLTKKLKREKRTLLSETLLWSKKDRKNDHMETTENRKVHTFVRNVALVEKTYRKNDHMETRR